jgi:CspA family cold shock protein
MYFRADRAFGAIRPDDGSKNLVVHWTQIMSDSRAPSLKAGDRVEYTVLDTGRGLYACDVWRTSDPWLDWWEAPDRCASLVDLMSSPVARAAEETADQRAEDEVSLSTGTVVFFKDDKGYGFIRPDAGGKDVFFHWSEIVDAGVFPSMKRGQWVEYWLVDDPDGPRACSVRVLGYQDAPEPGDPQSTGPTVDPGGRCVERPSDWTYEPPS